MTALPACLHPWWLDCVAPSQWRRFAASEAEDEPVIVARTTGPGIARTLRPPPFVWACGPTRIGAGWDCRLSSKGLAGLERLAGALPHGVRIAVPLRMPTEGIIPFAQAGFEIRARATCVIAPGAERVVSSSTRRNIRRAERRYDVLETVSDDEAMDVVRRSFARRDARDRFDEAALRRLLVVGRRRGAIRVLAAVESGRVAAVAVLALDAREWTYVAGGYRSEEDGRGAMALVLDCAIRGAHEVDRAFHFEGSMLPGVSTFFRRLGGVPQPVFVIEREGTRTHRLARSLTRVGRELTELTRAVSR